MTQVQLTSAALAIASQRAPRHERRPQTPFGLKRFGRKSITLRKAKSCMTQGTLAVSRRDPTLSSRIYAELTKVSILPEEEAHRQVDPAQ